MGTSSPRKALARTDWASLSVRRLEKTTRSSYCIGQAEKSLDATNNFSLFGQRRKGERFYSHGTYVKVRLRDSSFVKGESCLPIWGTDIKSPDTQRTARREGE